MLNLVEILLTLSLIIMTIGYLSAIVHCAKTKDIVKTVKVVFIPFYVFRYILKMDESHNKKLLAIATMGTFTVYLLAGIFKIVMTPPL